MGYFLYIHFLNPRIYIYFFFDYIYQKKGKKANIEVVSGASDVWEASL